MRQCNRLYIIKLNLARPESLVECVDRLDGEEDGDFMLRAWERCKALGLKARECVVDMDPPRVWASNLEGLAKREAQP